MLKSTLGKHRGVFVVVSYENGKRKRHSLGTTSREEALALFSEYGHQIAEANRRSAKTVSELFSLYTAYKKKQGKPTERIQYAWKNLSGAFGGLLPHQITDDRVHDWTASRELLASKGTIHVELGYLRAALRWAVSKRYITETVSIQLPSKPRPKTDYVPRSEFPKLLEAVRSPHLKLFLILAIATGGRASALLELTWDRIDFEKRLIQLDNPERHQTSKGRAIVPMNRTAFEALSEAKKGRTSDYVIEWGGLPVSSVKTAFRLLSKRSGLKVTPHMLRHSAAVWMAEGGIPMSEISQYLGHSNTAVTERVYARFSPGYLQKAASILDL